MLELELNVRVDSRLVTLHKQSLKRERRTTQCRGEGSFLTEKGDLDSAIFTNNCSMRCSHHAESCI